MKSFDKKICLANIYYLAKEKNIKIGDLETAAGVSVGYLSRINKEDNETNPSIELLISVAKTLDVSLDALINYEFDRQTPTEVYLLKFVEKLTHDTIHNDYAWRKETEAYLKNLGFDQNGDVDHPLMTLFDPYEQEHSSLRYISHFADHPGDGNIDVHGDCFNANLPGGACVYLMHVVDISDFSVGYELYLFNNHSVTPLCNDRMHGGFASALENLYSAVSESCKHIKIDSMTRNIIDSYMQGAASLLGDDLPF